MRRWTTKESKAWRAFVEMHHRLERHLVWHLQREFAISGADFEILVNVSESPRGRLAVTDLADAILWEKSRLSHQLSRMADRGLLSRDTSARRRHTVTLTAAGRKIIAAAAPANAERIRELFIDVLGPSDLDAMAQSSAAVLEAIDAHLAGSCVDGDNAYPVGPHRSRVRRR